MIIIISNYYFPDKIGMKVMKHKYYEGMNIMN